MLLDCCLSKSMQYTQSSHRRIMLQSSQFEVLGSGCRQALTYFDVTTEMVKV
jgi:hypothetical protein